MAGRRVTLIANEVRGLYPAGGMGTATTFLALALARLGHSVELLIAWQPDRPLDAYWEQTYRDAGIHVRRAHGGGERVAPPQFAIPHSVDLALREDPPDVLVATDLSAPAYCALRLRQAGLAFGDTLFVVFCHGTRRWILELSGRLGVRDLQSVLATSVLERAALELADVVVSPSAYLVGWMREHGWNLPERTMVVPYFTHTGATGARPPEPAPRTAQRVRRISFFGRFEDKKGIGLLVAAVNALDPGVLDGIELEFVGKPTTTWTPDRVGAALSDRARNALRSVTFASDLDQPQALAHLRRPGTLTVIPSLGDNSPNTVYECLEHGIPFLATAVGGIPELIAATDRPRVLFEPTVEGARSALERALSEQIGPPPTPAFAADASAAAWTEVLASFPRAAATPAPAPGPYSLLLGDGDTADDELESTLAHAQAVTGADVVTCAARVNAGDGGETVHFFSGAPGGLGVLANDYGTAALVRSGLADGGPPWPLLARLAADGARIVSLPLPLVTCRTPPATIETNPQEALLVAQALERTLPDAVSTLPRLVAGLAATTSARSDEPATATRRWSRRARSFARRALAATRGNPT